MPDAFPTAVSHLQAGRWKEAAAVCRTILQRQPRHADAWQLLGLALGREGDLAEAVKALEQARQLQPGNAPLANNLGEMYRQAGRLTESEQSLREALRRQPRFAEAAFNLGNTLKDQGRAAEAIASFQQALAWRPDYPKAHLNLANTLRSEGRVPRAVEHYRHYLRLQPPRVDVLLSLGGAHAELGEHHRAQECYQQAAALEPDNPEVITAQGNAAQAQGDIAAATPFYRRLAARSPGSLLRELRLATLCDLIPDSDEAIEDYRTRLVTNLEELRNRNLSLDPAELHSSGAEPPMAWAYYGGDNRPLKEAYAALFADKLKPLELRTRSGRPFAERKATIGVVVTHGHEGVYAECLGRLVARLPNDDLDVSVVCSRAGANILQHLLGDSSVSYLPIPDRIDQAATLIRDAGFDLLHYWEIGTDSQNYFLPFFRPAPLQSGCWGWPVTSGQPHVDYFVSSRLIEADDADSHYTEQLIRLETLPTWYARPPVPTRLRTRDQCGLPIQGAIYLCTQNLRKYHPDFDALLGELLRRDPAGWVCVIEDAQPPITSRLRERFTHRLPDVANRIVFLPRRDRADYLHTVALADVMLDTPHYGGGANSLYDAFACGTPVVTLPGPFHRSRYALGAYRKLGITNLIAKSPEDYAALALRVAAETEWRHELSKQIQAASDCLFADDSAVAAHREFLLAAIAGTLAEQ